MNPSEPAPTITIRPNLNPSPKQRFQKASATVSRHRDMASGDAFQTGADFAMLQFTSDLARTVKDQVTAMSAGLKLQGAYEFLQEFRLLAETPRPPQTTATDNVNPNA
jgi:hypothetical protein